MIVTIPARAQHEGVLSVTVEISNTYPQCGRERGEPGTVRSYDGSRILYCDGWSNPCGHVDKYSAVRDEAIERMRESKI
jgi:hypothetical protein